MHLPVSHWESVHHSFLLPKREILRIRIINKIFGRKNVMYSCFSNSFHRFSNLSPSVAIKLLIGEAVDLHLYGYTLSNQLTRKIFE